MLKQITDKDTLLALLKADKPIVFVGTDEDGEIYHAGFNDMFNAVFTSSKAMVIADFEEDDEPSDSADEPEPAEDVADTTIEEPPVSYHRGPKPIDKGKVKALLQAGWTDLDIADEMDCTEKRIKNFRLKMEERGEIIKQ